MNNDMNIVLYTQRVEIVKSYGERRDCADQNIAKFILACGFLPVPIPNVKEVAEKMVSSMKPSGIIFTGGNSLVKYGGDAPERDETERYLLQQALEQKNATLANEKNALLTEKVALEQGLVESGDDIVIVAGVPVGVSGSTNTMRVRTVK